MIIIKPIEEYDSGECAGIVFFVIFFLLLLAFFGIGCSRWYVDNFANTTTQNLHGRDYNPLYTSPDLNTFGSYRYTQPPGDVAAQNYGRSGQGTSGEFFPLQGRASGTFMKNSALNGLSLPSANNGTIGGQPNYTQQEYTPSWFGYNNFGSPIGNLSNSYLIDGSNQRVSNPGQKTNLECPNWWPLVSKGSHQFCTQGSDAMVPCKSRTIGKCKGSGGRRFLKSKNTPQWKKVVNA